MGWLLPFVFLRDDNDADLFYIRVVPSRESYSSHCLITSMSRASLLGRYTPIKLKGVR